MNIFSWMGILSLCVLLLGMRHGGFFQFRFLCSRVFPKLVHTSGIIFLIMSVLIHHDIVRAESSTEHVHDHSEKESLKKPVTITNPKASSIVRDDVILLGRYSPDVVEDIWTIIWPEKTLGVGWPQYGNPALGTPVTKQQGHWSVNAHFGDPPQSFEIAVYTSSPTATSFLQQQFKDATSQGKAYQGIKKTDLPEGLIEHERISVKKGENQNQSVRLLPLVESIQRDLAQEEAKTGYTYYIDKYSKNEVYFWSEIAGWMVVDAISRTSPTDDSIGQILDLGCGFGTLLAYASTIYGEDGICFDIHDYFGSWGVNNFNKKYHLTYVQGDIERGTLPGPQQFSVIIMTEVMEHLNFQPVPTLEKIYHALAPGGSFFLSTPDADLGWGRNHKYYQQLSDLPPLNVNAEWKDDHIWHYNIDELKMVLEEAGFTIKKIDHSYNPSKEGYGHFNAWVTK